MTLTANATATNDASNATLLLTANAQTSPTYDAIESNIGWVRVDSTNFANPSTNASSRWSWSCESSLPPLFSNNNLAASSPRYSNIALRTRTMVLCVSVGISTQIPASRIANRPVDSSTSTFPGCKSPCTKL